MKNYICLLFLLVAFTCFTDSTDWLTNINRNDISDYAERPCPHNDLSCIRQYFAQHSHCKVAHGSMPDAFMLERLVMPHAVPNITFVINNAKLTGGNGNITEFTINKKSNNLVLAIEVTDLTIVSPNTDLKYHRKAKEPIVLSDKAMITFASITLTAVIPNIDNLDISELEVSSYIEDNNPVYAIGPRASKSLDEDVIMHFNKLVRSIPDVIKETLFFVAPVVTLNFIQYNICDFGYMTSA